MHGYAEPGSEKWLRRQREFMLDDAPVSYWWLSFVDTDLPYREEGDYPGGPRWLGFCIVPAPNIVMAGQFAYAMGCNPGGQVAGYPFTVDDGYRVKGEYVGRLFSGVAGRATAELDLNDMIEPVDSPDDPGAQ